MTKKILEDWTSCYHENDYYQWAIVLKQDENVLIGSISVVGKNDQVEMVEIGYCIGKAWWNQGIVSEALSVLIKFFFEEVGVNRIEARHDPRNSSSGKVMLKCGLRYEGTQREADWNNQGRCDTAVYAILAKDYKKLRENAESTTVGKDVLLLSLDKIHTTELGIERIKKNLNLDVDDVVAWCIQKITDPNSCIVRRGKNWYVNIDEYEITVNASSYTIITAHKIKKRS